MDARVDLEMALSRVLTKARVIERALHGSHRWGFRFGQFSFSVDQVCLSDTGVAFSVENAWDGLRGRLELVCDGETVLVGDWVEADDGDTVEFAVDLMEAPALT